MKLNPDVIEYIKTHAETVVDLEAEAQDDENIKRFAEILNNHRSINTLQFAESQINDEQLKILSETIAKNQSLQFIDFSINPITETGIEYLVKALRKNTSIQVVNLSYIQFTSKSLEQLNQAFSKSVSITRVIPEQIITAETRQALANKEALNIILELISSKEAPRETLEKIYKIARERHSSDSISPKDAPNQVTQKQGIGIFS